MSRGGGPCGEEGCRVRPWGSSRFCVRPLAKAPAAGPRPGVSDPAVRVCDGAGAGHFLSVTG